MASANRALPDLLIVEPWDKTNYQCWSHKLLIFFEQLKVDFVLYVEYSDAFESANASTNDTNLNALAVAGKDDA